MKLQIWLGNGYKAMLWERPLEDGVATLSHEDHALLAYIQSTGLDVVFKVI